MEDAQISSYPTYGYEDSQGKWKLPVRVRVHKSDPVFEHVETLITSIIKAFAESIGIDGNKAIENFNKRLAGFGRKGLEDQQVSVEITDDAGAQALLGPNRVDRWQRIHTH